MARQRKPPSTSTPSESSRVAATTVTQPSSIATSAHVKQRVPYSSRSGQSREEMPSEDIPMSEHSLVDGQGPSDDVPFKPSMGPRSKWIVLAIASGACAAFNGVFAKLATGELTSSIAKGVAHFLHLSAAETFVNIVVRCIFFGLNLAFNGIMWTLFTKALARGHSTTQVSIMNTSSNFVLTAFLGSLIFSESLPPLWWLGAALLLVGNVIIGQKDESPNLSAEHGEGGSVDGFRDADDHHRDDGSLSGAASPAVDEFGAYRDAGLTERMLAKQLEKEDDDDVLDLGIETR